MSELAEREWEDSPSGKRWRLPFTWLGLITLAWALYELTAQPALGAVALCMKLGWDDFRTAYWLRKRDPSRRRGRTCFWLYLANGAWKVCVIAFLTTMILIVVAENRRGPGRGNNKHLLELAIGTGLTVGFGLMVALATTMRTIWLAWQHGIRLWLHSGVHHAWNADVWPPHAHGGGQSNRVGWLVFPQLILAFFILDGIALSELIAHRIDPVIAAPLFLLLSFLVGPVSGLLFRDVFYRHLMAQAPVECWGGQIGDEVYPTET